MKNKINKLLKNNWILKKLKNYYNKPNNNNIFKKNKKLLNSSFFRKEELQFNEKNVDYLSLLYKYHLDIKRLNFFKINSHLELILKKFNLLISKWYLYNNDKEKTIYKYVCYKNNMQNNLYLKYKLLIFNLFNNNNNKIDFTNNTDFIKTKYNYYFFEKYYSFFKEKDNETLYSTWNVKSLDLYIIYRKYKNDLYKKNKYLYIKLYKLIIISLYNLIYKYLFFLYKSFLYFLYIIYKSKLLTFHVEYKVSLSFSLKKE